jgi:hypothetical protein
VNMVEILLLTYKNGKIRPVENITGMGERG